MPAAVKLTPLPPIEAIAFFRSKGLEPSFAWEDVWQEEHAKAFTVAKMMNRDLLEETRAAVEKALAEGTTFEQFKAELTPKLKAAGWWGKQLQGDPSTGEIKLVQLGSNRRLRTIFDTNLRSAYSYGQWQRIERTKERFPFLMYDAVDDGRTRPEHRAMDGHIARVDDPIWLRWCPPCGWRCRCDLIQLTARMAAAQGGESPPKKFQPQVYTNRRTGKATTGERGIDPGFNFNIGKAPLRPLTAKPGFASDVDPKDAQPAIDGFLSAAKATKPRVVKDKGGWPLAIGPDVFVDNLGNPAVPRPDLIDRLPEVGAALAKPDKVEWVWRGGGGAPIDPRPEAIAQFVPKVLDVKSDNSLLAFGKAPAWMNTVARGQGFDLTDFSHVMDGSGIRHAWNRHSDVVKEAKQGQIAITKADFGLLPQIFARPDLMVFGLKDHDGIPLIGLVQDAGSLPGTWVYFVQYRGRKWQVATKSLRRWKGKFSGAVDATEMVRSLDLNAHDDTGADPRIVDLRGKINFDAEAARPVIQPSLIRRYTKRVDTGEEITIDFSRDGWTYDIAPASKP